MEKYRQTNTWIEWPESRERAGADRVSPARPSNLKRRSSEGESVPLTEKRLSGAQRRKLTRERKIAEGTWTPTKPLVKHQEGGSRPRPESPERYGRTSQPRGYTTSQPYVERRRPEVEASPPRKRLSGAQQRKLKRKAELIRAGLLVESRTQHEPFRDRERAGPSSSYRPSHSDSRIPPPSRAPERRRSPDVRSTWVDSRPSRQPLRDRERAGPSSSSRPPRTESRIPSPSRASKRPRSPVVKTEPSDDTTKSYRMAVTHRQHPDITLNKEQADLIQAKVIAAIDKIPDGEESPQFHQSKFDGGVLWMNCVNLKSRNFFLEVIRSHEEFWQGASLSVLETSYLTKRPKVVAWIKEPVEESTFRTRLRKQNPELNTADWKLLKRNVHIRGQSLAYSLDDKSFAVLERDQFKAFWGLGTVVFRVKHDLKEPRPQF